MAAERAANSSSFRLAKVPVLVVEDDPAGARMLMALFQSEGAVVRHASNAEDALLLLRDFPAKVLIVDLVLPTMSGLVFVQECKARPSFAGVIAVAVSAMNGPRLEALAVESGCVAYVRKPIDLEHLIRIVVAHLKGQS